MTKSVERDRSDRGGGRYAQVNGLKMYYELHGDPAPGSVPLLLLHGGLSAIGTSFGGILAPLAQQRSVIAVEFQAHGHTADIDRPLTAEHLADDVVALLQQLGIKRVDILGYSMGADVALAIGVDRPQMVRKLVLVSVSYRLDGVHPGVMEGIGEITPEVMQGTPFYEEYARIAPRPEDFGQLLKKIIEYDQYTREYESEQIRALPPTLLILGDSDIVQPEHAVEMFRLLGGGVAGDNVGLPASRLAILPGTTHITVAYRAEWLVSMINEFLEAPEEAQPPLMSS